VSIDSLWLDSKQTSFSLPLPIINQSNWSTNVSIDYFLTHYKGDPFHLPLQQSMGNIDQQLCQSTSSQLKEKSSLFSTGNQPVMSINYCINWLLLLALKGKPYSFSLSQQSIKTKSINNCVVWWLCYLFPLSTINQYIDQQLCWLTSSQLKTKGNPVDNPGNPETGSSLSRVQATWMWPTQYLRLRLK